MAQIMSEFMMGVKKLENFPSSKEVLTQAAKREKIRTTLYFDKVVYEEFKRHCDKMGVTTSAWLQGLMIDVLRGCK